MIPKNTAKIIILLLKSTEKIGYNINQIAKESGASVGSAFKILKEMEKRGIVVSQSIGNALYYVLNFENEEAVKICELLLIDEKHSLSGHAKLYAESIREFDKADLIVLFGSVLEKKEFNDVDVLFIGADVRKVNKFCLELSKIRTKPVVPFILKKQELINEIKNKKEALLSIVKEGVVLKGESVFIEVLKNVAK